MTLRELVLEVRQDVKSQTAKLDTHLLEHAMAKGRQQGEKRILGIARSTFAVMVSVGGLIVAIWSAVH